MKLLNAKIYTTISLLVVSFDAYAYLDPGTGGMLIQALLAMLIGAGVFLKNVRVKIYFILSRIKGAITKRSPVDKENDD